MCFFRKFYSSILFPSLRPWETCYKFSCTCCYATMNSKCLGGRPLHLCCASNVTQFNTVASTLRPWLRFCVYSLCLVDGYPLPPTFPSLKREKKTSLVVVALAFLVVGLELFMFHCWRMFLMCNSRREFGQMLGRIDRRLRKKLFWLSRSDWLANEWIIFRHQTKLNRVNGLLNMVK